MTHSEIKKILDMADANKDGKLDYEEVRHVSNTTRVQTGLN